MEEISIFFEKFAAAPNSVKLAGIVMMVSGFLFFWGVAKTKVEKESEPVAVNTPVRAATSSGDNSPVIQTGDHSTVNFHQGATPEQVKEIAQATAQEIRRGMRPERRLISPEQETDLRLKLSGYSGAQIKFTYIFGDPEAAAYSERIKGLLERVGFQLELFGIGTSTPPFYGLTVHVRDANNPPRVAVALVQAFSLAKISVAGVAHPEWAESDSSKVEIQVGLAPVPE